MVLFPCVVICRNLLILLTRLLSFSLRKWTLFRHFSHMRVHCTYKNGKFSMLAGNQLANHKKNEEVEGA